MSNEIYIDLQKLKFEDNCVYLVKYPVTITEIALKRTEDCFGNIMKNVGMNGSVVLMFPANMDVSKLNVEEMVKLRDMLNEKIESNGETNGNNV